MTIKLVIDRVGEWLLPPWPEAQQEDFQGIFPPPSTEKQPIKALIIWKSIISPIWMTGRRISATTTAPCWRQKSLSG